MNISVLLLVYNRPKETSRILKLLSKYKFKKIYVSSDGPKKNDELNINFHKNVSILNSLDKKKYSINRLKKNYGCKIAVSKGINWFFKNETKGIILEDDCIPNSSFFKFCEIMLNKYKKSNVMVISGNNFLRNKIKIDQSYYFSKYNHCWGWATWKRSWIKYDGDMKKWKKFKSSKKWKTLLNNNTERRYWEKIFNLCKSNKIDSWAYPWLLSIWINNGCTIIPKYNLVKNIGEIGTNNSFYKKNDYKTKKLNFNLIHPNKIKINLKADSFVMENFFKPNNTLFPGRLLYIINLFLNNPVRFMKLSYKKIFNNI